MTPLARDLLTWYEREKRILPWREQVNPYRTWISETMLQQTRVGTVIPYFQRFMERFPDVGSLAQAQQDEVLSMWSGLGYYSRARNLHKAAQLITAEGRFPNTVDELKALPGVGPYMAGAIASIAFAIDAPTVDGNIARVMARVHRDGGKRSEMWVHAAKHLPAGRAGDHNQALMDLGARICVPRKPDCEACPIRSHCAGFVAGDATAYPPAKAKKKVPTWFMAAGILQNNGRVLLGQRPPNGLFGGLYEPPIFRVSTQETAAAELQAKLAAEMGLATVRLLPAGQLRHVLTHRKIELSIFHAETPQSAALGPYQQLRWWTPSEPHDFGLSTLAKKAITMGLFNHARQV
jgi:A/G-specific adenine glycosylase